MVSANLSIFDVFLTDFESSTSDFQLSHFYKHIETITNIKKFYSECFTSKKRVMLCLDNIGKGTNALNSISLILTYTEQLIKLKKKSDLVMLAPCLQI